MSGCDECGGMGCTIVEADDGRTYARLCFTCAKARVARQFGGQERGWWTWVPRPELEKAVSALQRWRGPNPQNGGSWCVLLHAVSDMDNLGAGKTHAIQAVMTQWAASGHTVKYIAAPELLDAARRAIAVGDEPPVFRQHYDLVAIDDVGLGSQTPWAQEVIEGFVDMRYRNRQATMMATNLSIASLERAYPRLTDRAFEGIVIPWSAKSWRRK